ncbi:MAG: lysophospholipid acyltransferase family protein [Planctomycetota bacterium]|jgi:KDO2-lipid IV(A) lauroyltransferase
MKKRFREIRWQVAVPAMRVISFLIGDLPRRPLIAVGRAIGLVTYLLSRKDRVRALDHLGMAFPDLSTNKIKKIARKAFDNLAVGIVEALVLHRWSKEYIKSLFVNFEDMEKLLDICKDNGTVLVTGHVGNWELLAASFARFGGKVHVVGRRMQEENFDSFLTKLREASGLTVIYSDSSPKQMLKALRKNISIGILPDQDITEIEGVFVDFFDKKAYTPNAPAKLALTAGKLIYVVLLVREGEKFRLIIQEPVIPEKKKTRQEKEDEILRITQSWSLKLESVIRRYPDQWVWMHRRWRNSPERIARRKGNQN